MKKALFAVVCCLIVATSTFAAVPKGYGLKRVSPESVGMSSKRLEKLDSIFNGAVAQKDFPGAVVCVVKDDKIVYEKAFGVKQWLPKEEGPMTVETVFDMASLSKCVGTTLSFMQLIENGQVRLTDYVKDYIPGFAPWVDPETGNKVDITIQHLLTHSSGLEAYINVARYEKEHPNSTPDSLINYIATKVGRTFRPGTNFRYSCLNFVTLQNVLQNVTGEKLCDYAQKNVFDKLGLKNTHYYPIGYKFDKETLANIAPTEVQADGKPYRGQVHDPIANKLNWGNSGNAGVFSNAEDLAIIAAALMNGGEWNGRRVMSAKMVERMFTVPAEYPAFIGRGLGWDFWSSYASPRGDLFSRTRSANHTGYTGTSMVMDLDEKVALIVLTNRVHPSDGGNVSRSRAVAANVVASAILK